MKARPILQAACVALALGGLACPAFADDSVDTMAKDLIDKALKDANAPAQPAATPAASDNSEALAPLAGNKLAAPVPATAGDLDYDAEGGTLEFNTPSSVKQLAEFYRAAMKALGWSERRSVINKDNMVVLNFAKGEDKLDVTILRMGDQTNVSAHGALLLAQGGEATTGGGAKPDANAPNPELTAEDSGGLPIPAPHSSSGSEGSLFRHSANASTAASLDAVLAFYRRELAKLGWKELSDKAVVKPDSALLSFTSPDGPASLKLARENDETTSVLSVRDEAKVAKSPLRPKPGQVKVLFGNIGDKAAEIAFNGKTVKVAAGAGAKGPDGPTADAPPGKYDLALKSGGRETLQAGADEIWIVMVGPGGLLLVQAY